MMATSYMSVQDPATLIKRRIANTLDPTASPASDPVAPISGTATTNDAADFQQPLQVKTSAPNVPMMGVPTQAPAETPPVETPPWPSPRTPVGIPRADPSQPIPPAAPLLQAPAVQPTQAIQPAAPVAPITQSGFGGGTADLQTSAPSEPQRPAQTSSTNSLTANPNPDTGDAPAIDAIKGFYQKYLGRDASLDEAMNWLSGNYGYGKGAADLSKFEDAIKNSPEAQAYAKAHGQSGSADFPYGTPPPGFDPKWLTDGTAKYYAPGEHGPGEPALIGTPQGYYVQNADGSWGNLVPRGPESPAAPSAGAAPAAAGTGGSSGGSDAYNAYLDMLRQQYNDAAARRAALQDLIMKKLGEASAPVNENDLAISQPLAAARDEVQRSQDAERTALAERLYAQGGGSLQSGELGQAIQQSAERNAGGLSQLRAGLITQQYQAKQQELETLLSQALASGDTQSAQLLQGEIAALNAAVSREGMGISLAEFLANLNQNVVNAGAGA